MAEEKDYRNTQYCPMLDHVVGKKQILEEEIKTKYPRTRIIYNKVHNRKGPYHKKFANIYNNKCAYCGALWGLLPVESFEVDHFLHEASFPPTTGGKADAGRMMNLVWSCISCNRGKHGIMIESPYDQLLNVDTGGITDVFRREPDFSIRIRDTYQNDEFIQKFYKALHLNHEARRLDYLALELEGKYQEEKNEERRQKLGEILSRLMKRRNCMVTVDEDVS